MAFPYCEWSPTANTKILPLPSTTYDPEIKNGLTFSSLNYLGTFFLTGSDSPVTEDSSQTKSCPSVKIPSTGTTSPVSKIKISPTNKW